MTRDDARNDALFDVSELAELGGVSRRTVRYYVQRGLLPAPTGTGRGKHYTQAHLDRLVAVRTLQEAGVSLAEIEHRVLGAPPPQRPPVRPAPGEVWTRLTVIEGVELHVRGRFIDAEGIERLADVVRQVLDDRGGQD